MHRRTFLRTAGAVSVGLLSPRFALADEKAVLIKGKDERLIVQSMKPEVLETPLSLLDGQDE